MRRIEHPFFDALDWIIKNDSFKAFEHGRPFPKREMFNALKNAHPVNFDKACTHQGIEAAGYEPKADDAMLKLELEGFEEGVLDQAKTVEEFSLPFATSLYLLNDCPTIIRKSKDKDVFVFRRLGYLIQEITPERLIVYDFMRVKLGKDYVYIPDFYEIDLAKLGVDKEMNNFASDILCLNRFSNMLSVKRIGIEKGGMRTIKTKGFGIGYTTIKTDNILHVADKREYEYLKPLTGAEGDISWIGWWRAHWRAFYKYEGDNKLKDHLGRNIVDYSRIGKNRSGEYKVNGYTWVTEHVKGADSDFDIKMRFVKRG